MREKQGQRGGFGSNWTTDIRKYLIEGANIKVEALDPNLPFKKGNYRSNLVKVKVKKVEGWGK